MLNELTPEQEAQLKPWSEKWLAKSLATGEADWDTFEQAAGRCYILVHHKPVPVTRCQSPVVAIITGPLVASLLQNGPQELLTRIRTVIHAQLRSMPAYADKSDGDMAYLVGASLRKVLEESSLADRS